MIWLGRIVCDVRVGILSVKEMNLLDLPKTEPVLGVSLISDGFAA